MTKTEKYIKQIIASSNNNDMEELEEIFYKALRYLSEHCSKLYDEICMDIYVLANGECVTKEDAIEYVHEMPLGEKWSYDTVVEYAGKMDYSDYSKQSLYYVMNMMFNDYNEIIGNDTNTYLRMSKAFLTDADAPKGDAKVFRYINAMKK